MSVLWLDKRKNNQSSLWHCILHIATFSCASHIRLRPSRGRLERSRCGHPTYVTLRRHDIYLNYPASPVLSVKHNPRYFCENSHEVIRRGREFGPFRCGSGTATTRMTSFTTGSLRVLRDPVDATQDHIE